jgi:hypothetical protein
MDEPAFCQRLIKAGLDFSRQHLWATVAQQQESIYLASIKR